MQIDDLLRTAMDRKASDLHLSATMPPMVRKDGEMRRLYDDATPLSSDVIARLLAEISPSSNLEEFEARRCASVDDAIRILRGNHTLQTYKLKRKHGQDDR